MTTRRALRSRLGAAFALSSVAILLAACGSSPSKHATTTTLPPLPPSVYGLVTLIGSGTAVGTGDRVERIQLTSVPPEVLPAARVGEFPDAVAISPNGKTAYVTSYTANSVTPIDLANGKAGRPIPAGNGPAGIAIAPDGTTAYVTDAGTSPIGDTVTPIDLVTDRALPPLTVGNAPIAIAISGGTAFVANSGSESVSTIDLATRAVGAAIPVAGAPQSIAFSGTDAWIAVSKTSLPSANSLTPINLVSQTAGTAVPVGLGPSAVAIEDGTAWVVCSGANSIVPVDVAGAHPHARTAVAVAGGPYAIALYVVRGR